MTDEKAIEKMLYDQQQGWPLCPPLRREDAGQTDPRSTEPPRQGRVHLRGLRHR